jgi:hypothetical protein
LFELAGALEHQKLGRENVHRLSILVCCRAFYGNECLVGFRARRHDFEDLALHSQRIAGPGRFWPRDLSAYANEPVRERQTAGDQKAHGDGRGVPAAGRDSTEDTGPGGCFFKMKWLWIELRCKRFDGARFHEIGSGGEALADVQILQIKKLHGLIRLIHRTCLSVVDACGYGLDAS